MKIGRGTSAEATTSPTSGLELALARLPGLPAGSEGGGGAAAAAGAAAAGALARLGGMGAMDSNGLFPGESG